MRVIAGKAKGHRLRTPTSGTRPMADRMKETLFSALGDVDGAKVLDLYAGSGSLGLEALSRGASHATFVENSRDAILKLEQNIDTTGFGDRSDVVWADVSSTLGHSPQERFDLIFLDPPYSTSASGVRSDLEAIVMGGFLGDQGRIALHRPMKERRPEALGLDLIWSREIGQAQLYVFTHEDEAR